ncbi:MULTISPECIES: hypothetical protein [unclassified Synechocystis]|uniref:hypothetical protein n=1 Tax=unclassified Synechocystis TaxID=2640012 RepID=UPI00040CC7F0|nr:MULTISPECIES: hypothetical protein [unclassified Synechocystis]AIE74688.1 hypothetical protein D082_21600 [Synechocystis sp. PCC 6714]MCT0253956.1 hypothetical protein [Synechocystis sp. CS-94]
MANPIVLTISTGRCGTTFLYKSFQNIPQLNAYVFHESLHANVAKPAMYHRSYTSNLQKTMLDNLSISRQVEKWLELADGRPVIEFGWTTSALVPLLHSLIGNQLKVLVLHRHPIAVAGSLTNKGHYTKNKNPAWAISPMHSRVLFPEFSARWPTMSPFEKSLYRWLEITAYGFEIAKLYSDIEIMNISSNKLFNDETLLSHIADFCRIAKPNLVAPSTYKNKTSGHDREIRPVGEEWQNYHRHPEFLDFATKIGYDMSMNKVKEIVSSYQMPDEFFPTFRKYTKYWQIRFYLGSLIKDLTKKNIWLD